MNLGSESTSFRRLGASGWLRCARSTSGASLQRKLEVGLSAQTVTHIRAVLNTALRQAISDRLLSWNPLSSVKRPKVKRHTFGQLTPDQARGFLGAAENSRLGVVFAIGLSLGLRRGEVLGLRWSDVSFEAQTLRIEQTIQRVRSKFTGISGFLIAEPKTERSRRTLMLPAMLIPLLRQQRARQAQERLLAGEDWHNHEDLVFTTPHGRPIEPRDVQTEFKAMLPRPSSRISVSMISGTSLRRS
jgi:integrase